MDKRRSNVIYEEPSANFRSNKRIKQGDSPSIFVKDYSDCAGNLVTFDNGGPDAYFGLYRDIQNIEVNDTLTVRTDYKGGTIVSLRPFVAGE